MKYKEQICYHMCRLFDVDHINVFLLEEYPLDYVSEKLKSLCLRAGNLIIALEPMPYSDIYDYLDGYEIIKKSGMDNAYLILDNWHWVKADHNYNETLAKEISEKVIQFRLTILTKDHMLRIFLEANLCMTDCCQIRDKIIRQGL